jgi:hypothetical protein
MRRRHGNWRQPRGSRPTGWLQFDLKKVHKMQPQLRGTF